MCDLCDGPLEVLGVLGTRLHLKCRNCGMPCSKVLDTLDAEEYSESKEDNEYV